MVMDHDRRLIGSVSRLLERQRQALVGLSRGLPRLRDLLGLPQQRFDDLSERLPRALMAGLAVHEREYAAVSSALKPRLLAERIRLEERALLDLTGRLTRALSTATGMHQRRLEGVAGGLKPRLLTERIRAEQRVVGDLSGRLQRCGEAYLQRLEVRFDGVVRLFDSLNYQSVLKRGYAVIRGADGRAVVSSHAAKPGDALEIEFQDGLTDVTVNGAAPSGQKPERKKPAGGAVPPKQGQLL